MLAVYRKSPARGRTSGAPASACNIEPGQCSRSTERTVGKSRVHNYFGNIRQPSTLKQIPVLVRFCVAALVHAVGNGECPHIFEPEVSDCAAWRGTGDLVDS